MAFMLDPRLAHAEAEPGIARDARRASCPTGNPHDRADRAQLLASDAMLPEGK
jgi:hypothetical protein